MFILGLRGRWGIKLMLEFHLVILISGILLYLFNSIIYEILTCVVYYALYVRTIKRMIHYKAELDFKTTVVSNSLIPDSKGSAKVVFYFHLFLFLLFPLLLAILFSGLAPESQAQAMSWIVYYYFGNLALIGMMIVKIQKYDE